MIAEDVYRRYVAALLSGDKTACRNIVQRLLQQGVGVEGIYLGLFQPSLYHVGELWECNQVSVAVEHLATSITEGLFALVYPLLFASERVGRTAVVSCAPNEYHQIGGKMVADVFELHGWDSHFLGANTPADDLLRLVDRKAPDVVALSLSVYVNMPKLLDVVAAIGRDYPRLRVLVGGQAFRWGGFEPLQSDSEATYVPSIADLRELIGGGLS